MNRTGTDIRRLMILTAGALVLSACVSGANPKAAQAKSAPADPDKLHSAETEKLRIKEETFPIWVSGESPMTADIDEPGTADSKAAETAGIYQKVPYGSAGTAGFPDTPMLPAWVSDTPLAVYADIAVEETIPPIVNIEEPAAPMLAQTAETVGSDAVAGSAAAIPGSTAASAGPATAATAARTAATTGSAGPAGSGTPARSNISAAAVTTGSAAVTGSQSSAGSGTAAQSTAAIEQSGESAEPALISYGVQWTADGFPVRLDGLGWIYLGEKSDTGEITYIDRSFSGNDTIFTFKSANPGVFGLSFQHQDSETGIPKEAVIEVAASRDGSGTGGSAGSATAPGDYGKAKRLMAQERFQEALYEYMAAFREGDTEAAAAIGELAFHTGEYGTSAAFWNKVMAASPGSMVNRGLIGYTEAVVQGKLATPIPVPELIRAGKGIPARLLMDAAGFLSSRNNLEQGILLYENLLSLYPEEVSDKLIYMLAKLYESESPLRDERKAIEYYRKIMNGFPLSEYWEESKDRIRYLERHYIHIR